MEFKEWGLSLPLSLSQMFLSSSAYPEIHGYLHFKEQGKKTWKKMYFLLRRSGLYFSTKGTSKVSLANGKEEVLEIGMCFIFYVVEVFLIILNLYRFRTKFSSVLFLLSSSS